MVFKKDKFNLQTQYDAKLGYEVVVDKSTELNLKSKHQSTTGIDLITKGTLNKSKAEKLLFSAKDLAIQGETLKIRGNEILTDSKNLEDIGVQAREEYKTVMVEVEETYRKYIELKRHADEKIDSSEKAIQEAELKYSEGMEFASRGQTLVDKANSLLQEANILNENANKWITEGNQLLDEAKSNSNKTLQDIGEYLPENFTIEGALNTIPSQIVEEVGESHYDEELELHDQLHDYNQGHHSDKSNHKTKRGR